MSRRDHELRLFNEIFPTNFDGLLVEVPDWVRCGIGRRLRSGQLTIVSAVCPDYERRNGKFTYSGLGEGVPFKDEQHLVIMEQVAALLAERGIALSYFMTLADT